MLEDSQVNTHCLFISLYLWRVGGNKLHLISRLLQNDTHVTRGVAIISEFRRAVMSSEHTCPMWGMRLQFIKALLKYSTPMDVTT